RTWTRSRAARDLDDDPLPALEQRYAWFLGPALVLFALATCVSERPWKRVGPKRRGALAIPNATWLIPLAVGLVSASPALDAEQWLRLGNNAFERGAYPQALDCYARAEEFTTDPGLVALNEAAALYRLGRYREAELHYLRALEDATDARRARALLDLGNALVQ